MATGESALLLSDASNSTSINPFDTHCHNDRKRRLAIQTRTKLFLRGKSGVEPILGPPSSSRNKTLKIERDDNFAAVGFADLLELTNDGKLLVLVRTASGFKLHDSDSGAVVVNMANPGIQAVAWSPLGSHLLTWQRPQKESDLGNLVAWGKRARANKSHDLSKSPIHVINAVATSQRDRSVNQPPQKKGKPASVTIFQFTNLDVSTATKSFYKAQDASPTTVKQVSFFLQSDGEYDCIVPLTKEGTVHDVAWDPTGRGFVVITGAMPANATLYDSKAIPVFEFAAAPRNHVSWNPHGRFLCLAGFGNLRGDMDFLERNKVKKMGSATLNSATTFAWSPDSRYFAVATTFPRLRVDNGYKIFR
ncbi:unnamed protein product [Hyaloperonospora brassicae]|uniref:Eukaryotic translation initiation factor 2A n=1 Tax=Hyaloperonospora brassicae TaxID=162125 RepID=A0AAV0TIB7_HYABA|nr:unnamed protein product [Hyaloperonospora brassicae]